jgi:hypothetical protein
VRVAGRRRARSRAAAAKASTYLLSKRVVCLQRNSGVWTCKTGVVMMVGEDGWTESCAVGGGEVRVPKRLASGAGCCKVRERRRAGVCKVSRQDRRS